MMAAYGLIFGITAVGINTGLGLLYPCAYGLLPDTDHTWEIAALSSAINIGAMVGALSGGEIANRIGKKKTMLIGGVLACASVWSMFAATYVMMFASRVFTGLGVGMTSSVCGAYVSEMAPPARRGFLGGLFQVFITLGIVIINVICYFVLGDNRDQSPVMYCASLVLSTLETPNTASMDKIRTLMIIASAAPVLFVLLVASPFVPEATGDEKEGTDPLLKEEPATLSDLLAAKRPFAIAMMFAVALQFTGINAVMFYCSKFLDSANVSQKILGTVIIMAWNFAATGVPLVLADRLGRRPLLIPSLATMGVSMIALGILVVYQTKETSSVFAFVLLGLFILGFNSGPGFLFWVICIEIFPTHVAQKGFAVVNMTQWVFTLVVTFCFPPLQNALGGWVFWLFGVPGVLVCTFMLFCLPETKGKTKQEITQELSGPDWIVWRRGATWRTVYEIQGLAE